jgi:LacI family transcriptional regulator
VAPATAERIHAAAAEVGYRPNPVASALVTGRSRVVALLVPYLDRPYYSAAIGRMEALTQQSGYDLIVMGGTRHGTQHIADCRWPVDGLLVLDSYEVLLRLVQRTDDRMRPVVALGGCLPEGVDAVRLEMGVAAEQAIRHLIGQGCRKLAYATSPATPIATSERWRAFLRVTDEAGIEPVSIPIPGESRPSARDAVTAYCIDHPDLDGLFCHNDDIACGAIRALLDLGRRVPDDVAVVGCDGTVAAEFAEPPISTIALPIADMCAEAWTMLLRRMENPDLPICSSTFSGRFIQRRSSCRDRAHIGL